MMKRSAVPVWLTIGSAVLALSGAGVLCPTAHAGAVDTITIPAPQLLNPNDAPAQEDKPQELDPDDDGASDLYVQWGDPVIVIEGQRQIFYIAILFIVAGTAAKVRRVYRNKRWADE